jgi:hypothetical protein
MQHERDRIGGGLHHPAEAPGHDDGARFGEQPAGVAGPDYGDVGRLRQAARAG